MLLLSKAGGLISNWTDTFHGSWAELTDDLKVCAEFFFCCKFFIELFIAQEVFSGSFWKDASRWASND
jgi:hypothetical protein